MPTIKEVLDEVHKETNAIAAVDLGLAAAENFAKEAAAKFDSDHPEEAGQPLTNLVYLIQELRKAVPANVVPASAGPVGKSPHEQYLEQARTIVEGSLGKMQEALKGVQETLVGVNEAVAHAVTASAAIQSPDLKKKAD